MFYCVKIAASGNLSCQGGAPVLFSVSMQNLAHTVARYADVFGLLPMTMAKQFRYQGEADQLPRGLRGQRVPNWMAKNHTFAIFGAVGNQPIDAVEAARVLYDLTCCTDAAVALGYVAINRREDDSTPRIQQGMKLGDWYTQEIENCAEKIEAGHVYNANANPLIEPRQLIVALNPAQATIMRPVIDVDGNFVHGTFHTEHFVGPDLSRLMGKNTPAFSRQTYISDQVLFLAGELLAATRAKRSAAPKSNPASAKVGEEAGDSDATPKKVETVRSANQDGLALVQPTSAPAATAASASCSASASTSRTKLCSLSKTKLMGPEEGEQPSLSGTYDHSGGRVRGEFLTL